MDLALNSLSQSKQSQCMAGSSRLTSTMDLEYTSTLPYGVIQDHHGEVVLKQNKVRCILA